MKRDMDLVRKLLLATEKAEEPFDPRNSEKFENYIDNVLGYHVDLLKGHELIDADIVKAFGGAIVQCTINGLTWDGADYLDAIKDEHIWKRTKGVIKKAVGSTTIGLIKETAILVAKKAIEQHLS